MKRSDSFFLRNTGDVFFLLPSDDASQSDRKVIFLNETGAFLWKKLEKNCTIDDLVQAISDHYDVSNDIAHQHVSDFLSFLSDNGCLDLKERI